MPWNVQRVVHLHRRAGFAVHRQHRRQGLAERLYIHFMQFARSEGCKILKATASPHNPASIAYHRALGMTMIGEDAAGW